MIVAMSDSASEDQIQQVIERLTELGFTVHRSTGARLTVLGVIGATQSLDARELEVLPGVANVHRVSQPYKLAGRSFRPEGTVVKLPKGVEIGGKAVVVMAGPCSIESREQIFQSAEKSLRRAQKFFVEEHSSLEVHHTPFKVSAWKA